MLPEGPVIDSKIELTVAGWEAEIKAQKMRPIVKRYPRDIRMIAKNIDRNMRLVGAFPIYYGDNVEDIIKKFCNVFTDEALGFQKEIHKMQADQVDNKGFSREKTMRLGLILPQNLDAIFRGIANMDGHPYPSNWWNRKIKAAMPKAFLGSMKSDKC